MPERAVPSDPPTASKFDKTGHPLDEKGEKPDRHGEWLADDARIWRVYERLAKLDDDEKVKRWSGGLNNLALFATLFSGITTAFLIESQGDMKPDFSELAYRVQNATAHGRPYVEEPFVVPGQARLVNCLWITSLLLSLSTALIAVMGQDWVEMYVDKPVCNPRQWAEIRSFRLNGVRRWYMPGVIATAPVLLHASLFLFGIGLAVFISSDGITQNLCIALCAIVAFLYAVIMFSPVLWSSSPFRSPATMLVRRWFCATFQRNNDKITSRADNAAIRYVAGRIAAVRRWMENSLSSAQAALSRLRASYSSPNFLSRLPTTYRDHILSHYGPASNVWMDTFRQWFRASFLHDGSYAPRWMRECCSNFRTVCGCLGTVLGRVQTVTRCFRTVLGRLRIVLGRILDNSRPDFSNGWSDVSERPLPGLVADSLSWLSSATSSPEVTQSVVAGLCDHVMGCQVAEHENARSLTQKLCRYDDGHWDHLSILDLSRYVIIRANTGLRMWPDRVRQRFKEVIDAETDISQDFLLALVHLTRGFRSEPLDMTSSRDLDYMNRRLADFERLCARIPDRNPITLSTIASAISRLRSHGWDITAVRTLSVLMNKWRDVLPLDLRPVEHALRAEGKTNKFCHSTGDRPINNILHFWIESFRRVAREATISRSIRDLVLSLARTASNSGIHHTCLLAMFGDINPDVTMAAWSDLPAHEIQWTLDQTCSHIFLDDYHADLRSWLARMIARCIRPPFPLRKGTISTQAFLPRGSLLYDLVKVMSKEGALPDDLFRPVLEVGALANLSASLHEVSGMGDLGGCFLWLLAAVALWIKKRRDGKERLELFELFTANTTRTVEGTVWNLVDAVGSTLAILKDYHPRELFVFLRAVEDLMLALKPLREMSPEPKYPLWAEMASKFGARKHDFSEYDWEYIRKVTEDGTGIDPEQFATETLSLGAGEAVQGDESAPGGSPGKIAPTNLVTVADTGTLAHPAPHIAWIAAGATPDDAI